MREFETVTTENCDMFELGSVFNLFIRWINMPKATYKINTNIQI